jgi:hypothetical protein
MPAGATRERSRLPVDIFFIPSAAPSVLLGSYIVMIRTRNANQRKSIRRKVDDLDGRPRNAGCSIGNMAWCKLGSNPNVPMPLLRAAIRGE